MCQNAVGTIPVIDGMICSNCAFWCDVNLLDRSDLTESLGQMRRGEGRVVRPAKTEEDL
jgi:hypothetical protein